MSRPDKTALKTIKVSEKGLPDEFPAVLWAREKRIDATRNGLIYRDWLKAEDKTAEIALLSERWGINQGSICRLIDDVIKGDRRIISHMLAEITVLRQTKGEEVLRDGLQHRSELDAQIDRYEKLRDSGEQFLIVEQTDDESAKFGLSVKTKKLPIDTILSGLYADRLKSQEMEGKALANYIPRPVQEHTGHIDLQILPPDTIFKEEFDRMEKMQRVETDAVVVE